MTSQEYREYIREEYFDWLRKVIRSGKDYRSVSYKKLLIYLHNEEFTYSVPMDANREAKGIDLRWKFTLDTGREESSERILYYLDGPCSVLEMMVALAIDCENLMDDPRYGDRTGTWFWGMINNLGLGAMHDDNYDYRIVDLKVHRFLDREYAPNGKGGLFTVRRCDKDMRDLEIWHQLLLYLNTIV